MSARKAVPIIRMDEQAAHNAFEAYAAMLVAERTNPVLRQNDFWRSLRDTAKTRFLDAFEAL